MKIYKKIGNFKTIEYNVKREGYIRGRGNIKERGNDS